MDVAPGEVDITLQWIIAHVHKLDYMVPRDDGLWHFHLWVQHPRLTDGVGKKITSIAFSSGVGQMLEYVIAERQRLGMKGRNG